MSLQKALKYAIGRKKFEILRLVKLGRRDDTDESESDNDGYEGDCESENDDEPTAKRKKLSEPCNPYIEYYVKQARANPSQNFIVLYLCNNIVLKFNSLCVFQYCVK